MAEEIRKRLEAEEQTGEKLIDEEMDSVVGGERIMDPARPNSYARCPYCGCRDMEIIRYEQFGQYARCLNDTCGREFGVGFAPGKYSTTDAN